MVPQFDRANAEAFDSTFVITCLNIFTDPKGIVRKIKHAGNDVANKSLRAKANRDANDARTGDKWPDLNA